MDIAAAVADVHEAKVMQPQVCGLFECSMRRRALWRMRGRSRMRNANPDASCQTV